MGCFIGIDVSTTATKAVLISDRGEVVGVASSGYGLSTPRPLWAEQDPGLWEEATYAALRALVTESAVDPASVRAIGLTGQMHGLVLLDDAGEVLRPAILWNDQRASAECDEIRDLLGLDELVHRTGNDAFPGFTAPKLLWVRNHEPEIYRRIDQVLLPKDYVRFRLTGEYATDRAGAGGTLLLDLATRDWSEDLVELLDVRPEWLPLTHEGPEVTGSITPRAAERTGLVPGTPVVAGGGDQAAQAVGVGAVAPGVVALTLGTSGVVFATTEAPITEPRGRLHAFPHAVPGRWHVMGVMLSAAGSLSWYRGVVAPEAGYDELLELAGAVEPGAEGLVFLPYLSGERTPHGDPFVRGGFLGLTLRHRQPHLTRAVLEGVAFGLRDSLDLMREVGLGDVRQIRLSGGGARNAVWRQLLADVLGVSLVTVRQGEGAAFGAALIAAVGAGAWPTVDAACADTVAFGEASDPVPGSEAIYGPLHRRFRRHYPAVRPLFQEEEL